MEHNMGLFCVNFHFRTIDDRALAEALNRRRISGYRILPAKSGWTSLYEEQASEQDDRRIRDLGSGLSEDLHVAAIAFLVHDSDIACYWLFDNGQLLDEYNSYPDYFGDSDGPPSPSGGRPEVLLRYCRPGVRQDELTAILAKETVQATTFAERLIEQLAKALGIDRNRAIADYRNAARDGGPGGMDRPNDDRDDDDDGGPSSSPLGAGLIERLAERFGFVPGGAPADPRVADLVQAAARGNTGEIDRLLADSVAIDAEAPAPLPGAKLVAGLALLFPGGVPQVAMTPLLAAIVHKQRLAAERLLDGGADPNRVDPRYGTPVHAAAGVGDVELLQLLLDRGGDVNARSAQGQTPLEMLAASRTGLDRLAQLQAAWKSMGVKLPRQMSSIALPREGWDACERLLKARGAR
jgi:hypothetical protein